MWFLLWASVLWKIGEGMDGIEHFIWLIKRTGFHHVVASDMNHMIWSSCSSYCYGKSNVWLFGVGCLGCLDGRLIAFILPWELQLYTYLYIVVLYVQLAFSTVKLATVVYLVFNLIGLCWFIGFFPSCLWDRPSKAGFNLSAGVPVS